MRAVAVLAVVAACFALGWVVLLANEYQELGKHMLAGAAFVSNFALWDEAGYFDTSASTKPLQHLWSLGVEEQFYIVWPAILFMARGRANVAKLTAIIGVASFALNVVIVREHPVAAFYSPLTRFWELMLGGLIAMMPPIGISRPLPRWQAILYESFGVCGLALIGVAIFKIKPEIAYPGWRGLLPTIGTALVILSGSRSRTIRLALGNRAAVGIGLISYPIYLWHWPLLSFSQIINGNPPAVMTRVELVIASVALAWATYQFIEVPIRFGSWRRHQAVVSICCGLMAVVAVAGYVTYDFDGLLLRFPKSIQNLADYQYDFKVGARVGKCWISATDPVEGFAPTCFEQVSADDAGKPRLLIWGDSYAARLYLGIKEVVGANYALLQLTRDGCPPVEGIGYQRCVESNRFVLFVLSEIARSPPDVVMLVASWIPEEIFWEQGKADDRILSTINDLKRAGVHRVIVVGPNPQWTEPLAKLVYKSWHSKWPRILPARLNTGLSPDMSPINTRLQMIVGKISDVGYVSPIGVLCSPTGCLTYAPGTDILTSWDTGHLTTPAAILVAKEIRDAGLLSAQ